MAVVLRALAFPVTSCCRESEDQDDTPAHAPSPIPLRRAQSAQDGACGSGSRDVSHDGQLSIRSSGRGGGGSAQSSIPFFDMLDSPLLARILAQCDTQDLVSARVGHMSHTAAYATVQCSNTP